MSVTLKGYKELQDAVERRYGRGAMKRVTDFALKKGGQKVVEIIKKNMRVFEDTGESVNETTLSKPTTIGGVRVVKIHWRGPRQRFRIIHLNEFGHFDRSGKWVNTKGKGVIERAMREGREVYFKTVKDELKRRG